MARNLENQFDFGKITAGTLQVCYAINVVIIS